MFFGLISLSIGHNSGIQPSSLPHLAGSRAQLEDEWRQTEHWIPRECPLCKEEYHKEYELKANSQSPGLNSDSTASNCP